MHAHLHDMTSRYDREPSPRMRIVVIGSGRIGGTLTRRLTQLGHAVVVANPETLEDLVRETGATASSTGDLPADADVVVLAIPFAAIPDLPPPSSSPGPSSRRLTRLPPAGCRSTPARVYQARVYDGRRIGAACVLRAT
jgi:NAD(P)-dependent dehydrogenase (short-subunit alcohol dehydrogenase family)